MYILNKKYCRGIIQNTFRNYLTTKYTSYLNHRDHAIRGFSKDGTARFSIIDISQSLQSSLVLYILNSIDINS